MNYARQAVARAPGPGGWTVSGNNANLSTLTFFPPMQGGAGGVVTYFGVGSGASGPTELDFFGVVSPSINVTFGVKPALDVGTVVTQLSLDGMANAAATAFLLLFFNNTAWANVGSPAGLQPSSSAGSLYLSLHTANPTEGGTQASNEISYT